MRKKRPAAEFKAALALLNSSLVKISGTGDLCIYLSHDHYTVELKGDIESLIKTYAGRAFNSVSSLPEKDRKWAMWFIPMKRFSDPKR